MSPGRWRGDPRDIWAQAHPIHIPRLPEKVHLFRAVDGPQFRLNGVCSESSSARVCSEFDAIMMLGGSRRGFIV